MKTTARPTLDDLERMTSILLTCSICGRVYSKPKLLPCCHTFCESCLFEHVPAESLTLTCPSCAANSILPQDGVASLKDNDLLNKLMEVFPNLQQSVVSAEPSNLTDQNDTTSASTAKEPETCMEDFHYSYRIAPCTPLRNCQCHNGDAVSTLCKLCERLICDKCARTDHAEHDASLSTIGQVAADCKNNLLKQAEEIRERVADLDYCLSTINSTCEELVVNRDFAEMSVKESFKKLEQELQLRKEETLRTLDAEFTNKSQTLDRQRGDLSAALRNMTSAVQLIHLSLDTANNGYDDSGVMLEQSTPEQRSICEGSDSDIKTYLLHRHMTQRLSNLRDFGRVRVSDLLMQGNPTTPNTEQQFSDQSHDKLGNYLQDTFATPNDNSRFEWRASEELLDLSKTIQTILSGTVITDHIVADKCVLSGSCLQESRKCEVGKEEQIFVTTKDYLGNLEPSKVVSFDVEISFPDIDEERRISTSSDSDVWSQPSATSTPRKKESTTEDDWKIDVQTNQPGCHEIHFTPKKAGPFFLNVKIHGRHVHNSPCHLTAEIPPIKNGSTNGKSPQVVMRPKSVRQKAMKRPQSAGPVRSFIGDDLMVRFGSRGRAKGEFANPQDVAADQQGRFFITDSNNQCVQIFELKEGFGLTAKCVGRMGSRGRGVGLLQRPSGIEILTNGEIAVADYENKVVNVFSTEGKYKSRIGHGKLMGPRGICLNRNGHLVVVDNKACQIFIFQVNGRLVTKFGNRGTGPSQLAGPHYAAVNQRNEIYVTDFYNHCVKVFTTSGTFLRSIGSKGEGCGQFNAPTGIAIDFKSHVIVADWGNSRIQILDEKGSFLSYINTDSEPLYGPQGIVATKNGYVAIADSGHQCVKVYRILQ
uniref:Tripartite motif-containing protein 2 n=1 Tax=Phallusia mammillata TaxID=59560 RepID=A0A6F9DUX7_9ASCI|nr:E3 ubiquitin-protein ligase TRIM71 [Phallusia mammillata]